MAYVTTGLTNGGVTAHYKFSYDQSLAGVEPARTNAVIAACEGDYNLMHGWFGGGVSVTGMSVQVTTQSNGASWSGSASSSTIQLKAQGESYSNNPAYLRYLLVAEVVEIFMMAQNIGWFQGGDEGSKGEGLSRFLSGQFLALNGFLGVGMDANYAVADLWLNSSRQDFVNNAPNDNGADATNGCTTLFIYYLFSQLGYSIDQIVGAGASTLAGVYRNLTGDGSDPFPLFKGILDLWFPSTTSSAVTGPNFDDPWPLLPAAYTGVWRSGSGPYYLWTGANQSNFLSKWQSLASQNMRLTDVEVTTVNGRELWSGIWEEGTDGYYLWIDADESNFLAKWSQLAAQNLRLISIKHYDGLWAGVWRQGTDGYYLWIDADESNFLAKWSQLAAQNLRLVDFDTYVVNGQRLWAGVWRQGSDGYYLWIDADWNHFVAKWSELATQNLRLIGVRTYGGLWAGIWRSGSDGYYLWANVSEANFIDKWNTLAKDDLRLVDMIAVPLDASGAPSGSLAADGAEVGLSGERIGTSEMWGRGIGVSSALTVLTAGEPAGAGVGRGGGAPLNGESAAVASAGRTNGAGSTSPESGKGGGAPASQAAVESAPSDAGKGGGQAEGGPAASAAAVGGKGGGQAEGGPAASAEAVGGKGGGQAEGGSAASAEALGGKGGGQIDGPISAAERTASSEISGRGSEPRKASRRRAAGAP
jgi:Polyglycine hydrolase-like, structural repeat